MSDAPDRPATFLSLRQAARLCGMSKDTLGRKIKSGEISAYSRGADGSYQLDPSELTRWMDAARVARSAAPDAPDRPPLAPAEPPPAHALIEERAARQLAEARLADLKAFTDTQIADLRATLSELRGDRDQWREQAQRLALPSPGRRWWRWRRAG
jgi:excisionase family DNA binding protein